METENQSLSENYFDDVYRDNDDPWHFEKSEYERKKYEATINALNGNKFKNAFEIGCSIGVLTKMLAEYCSRLLSVDIADSPLLLAKNKLGDNPNVSFQKMAVPNQFPDDNFDLIVMSEVGYFLSVADLKKLKGEILSHLDKDGYLLLVHWTPFVPDFPLTGDIVHDEFLNSSGDGHALKHLVNQRADTYRLDLFKKN